MARTAQEGFEAKLKIALKYRSTKRRVEELAWWIDTLSVYKDPSLFGEEITLLNKQIQKWSKNREE